MLDIISANPYRVLGVYSNSPKRELVANLSRINAFLRVGQSVSFPTDMPSLLSEIERKNEMVADANSKLALPADQFRYAQFWFVNATSFDDIALNSLIAGDIDKALSIWEKREDASSLQNRIVCNLILEQNPTEGGFFSLSDAISCAETLYTSYKNDFVKAILGDNPPIDTKNVEYDFLNKLCDELGVNEILPYISNENWKKHISSQAVKPLVDDLMNAVSVAKQSKGNGPEARYKAGTKLMNDTKKPLTELKKLTGKSDLQYQMVADKVGLEILQCGIDYYNNTKTYDAPKKAIVLMRYALSIVVGQMAKERCEENLAILQEEIATMPVVPKFVDNEYEAIENERLDFLNSQKDLTCCVKFLNNTKPYLQSVKEKLGQFDLNYLNLSTGIVQSVLHEVISIVNNRLSVGDIFTQEMTKNIKHTTESFNYLLFQTFVEDCLKEAWNVFELIGGFDMTVYCKIKYDEDRAVLRKICLLFEVVKPTIWERIKGFFSERPGCLIFIIICIIGTLIALITGS